MSEAKQKANAQSGRSLLGSCKEWPWAFRPKLLNCADLVNLLRFQGVAGVWKQWDFIVICTLGSSTSVIPIVRCQSYGQSQDLPADLVLAERYKAFQSH